MLSTRDYIIIGIGIFTLPFFIGFLILGTMAWIIGSRMEKEDDNNEKRMEKDFDKAMKQFDKDMDRIAEDIQGIEVSLNPDKPDLIDRKRFKLKSYSSKTLEDGK